MANDLPLTLTLAGEMKRIQPHGPYVLGGWSMGGVVAFEMACSLEENGEREEKKSDSAHEGEHYCAIVESRVEY